MWCPLRKCNVTSSIRADQILSEVMGPYDLALEGKFIFDAVMSTPHAKDMKKHVESKNGYVAYQLVKATKEEISKSGTDSNLAVKLKISGNVSAHSGSFNAGVHRLVMKRIPGTNATVPDYKNTEVSIVNSEFLRSLLNRKELKGMIRFHFYKAGCGLMDYHFDMSSASANTFIKCSERCVLKNVSV